MNTKQDIPCPSSEACPPSPSLTSQGESRLLWGWHIIMQKSLNLLATGWIPKQTFFRSMSTISISNQSRKKTLRVESRLLWGGHIFMQKASIYWQQDEYQSWPSSGSSPPSPSLTVQGERLRKQKAVYCEDDTHAKSHNSPATGWIPKRTFFPFFRSMSTISAMGYWAFATHRP